MENFKENINGLNIKHNNINMKEYNQLVMNKKELKKTQQVSTYR